MAVLLIEAYQRFVSPRKGFSCAYRVHTGCASCSTLGLRAVRRYGVWQGLGILSARFERCGEAFQRCRERARSLARQRGFLDLDGDGVCDACEVADCVGCDDCGDSSSRRKRKESDKPIYLPPTRYPQTTPIRDGHRLPFQDDSATADTTALTERELISMRLIDAPQRQVYGAFGNPQTLARWWLPEGQNGFHALELKPGGHWQYSTTTHEGTKQDHHLIFAEVSPPERIVLDVLDGTRCRITLSFGERGNKTLVRVRALFDTAAACDAARAGMQASHEQMLQRLEAVMSASE